MFSTQIYIWSRIGHTPITNRGGAYCDELLVTTVDCADPSEAKAKVEQLILDTPHGYCGYFNMIDHPNQNTRSKYVSMPMVRLVK